MAPRTNSSKERILGCAESIEMEDTPPGCLVASFTYENQQFKDGIRELMRIGIVNWRMMISERRERAAEQNPLQWNISIQTLADMFTAIIEGGILLARNFEDNRLLVDHILGYRSFVRMAFGAR